MVTASRWLWRNPSTPSRVTPTAARTVAGRSHAPSSRSAATGNQAQIDRTVDSTTSGPTTPAARATDVTTRSSPAVGSVDQTMAAVCGPAKP